GIDIHLGAGEPEHGRNIPEVERPGLRNRLRLALRQAGDEFLALALDIEDLRQFTNTLMDGRCREQLAARAVDPDCVVLVDTIGWQNIGRDADIMELTARRHDTIWTDVPDELHTHQF